MVEMEFEGSRKENREKGGSGWMLIVHADEQPDRTSVVVLRGIITSHAVHGIQ